MKIIHHDERESHTNHYPYILHVCPRMMCECMNCLSAHLIVEDLRLHRPIRNGRLSAHGVVPAMQPGKARTGERVRREATPKSVLEHCQTKKVNVESCPSNSAPNVKRARQTGRDRRDNRR